MPLTQAPEWTADGGGGGSPRRSDVAVIGAGPAGATAALCLARQGVNVLLVERPNRRPISVGEGLPPAARPLLKSLGLWERFQLGGHLPSFGNRSAWGSPELSETDFIFNPYGHGWHLDRAAFDAMLVTAAQDAGARRVCATVAWQPAASDAPGGALHLGQGTRLTTVPARLVLDCSGRTAVAAQRLGARRVHHDKLVAIAAVHTAERPGDEDCSTLVEAAPNGWWYTALLPRRRRVFVYLTDGDLLKAGTFRDVGGWLAHLGNTQHLRELHANFLYHVTTGPALFSAGSSTLQPVADSHGRWLAAGDAAICFDPLSSQGIVTAISTGRAAAEAISAVLRGSPRAVASYRVELDQVGREYLHRRREYYGRERRWPESAFWMRRHFALAGRR